MSVGPRTIEGMLAAAAQLAAGELTAALLPGARSPVGGIGQALIDATPGPGIDVVVATAESADKPLLKTALTGGWLAAGATAAHADRNGRAAGPAVLAALGIAGGVAGAVRRDADTRSTLIAGVAQAVSGPAALRVLRRRPSARSRAAIAAGAGAALFAAARRRAAQQAALQARRSAILFPAPADPAPAVPRDATFDIHGVSPLFTPNESFYVTDVELLAPRVDPTGWRLRIGGMADRELTLTLDDLLAMPLTEIDATLVCVHNPAGGERVGSARWLGVPLLALLERAGVQPDAEQVVARSVDGFTAGVPVDHVSSGAPALVALAMNGEPLPVEHGFPARLLVPGLWGADANTKWLTELELTTWGAVRDYWDRRGWPRVPSRVKPGSRIDVPRNREPLSAGDAVVAGVAWAPPHGVERVEVSIDGREWQAAELATEVAPTMWRHWRLGWQATPGQHNVRVRTIGRALTQRADPAPPYPVGSSGFQTVHVDVLPRPVRRLDTARRTARAILDDGAQRTALAAEGVRAWRGRGFPPPPRYPAPKPLTRSEAKRTIRAAEVRSGSTSGS